MPSDIFIARNEPTAALRRIPVYLVSSSTGLAFPGMTPSGSQIQISKNGANWANASGTWVEISGTGSGQGGYYYEFAQAECDTLGFLLLKIVISGAAQVVFSVLVVRDYSGTVVTNGSNTSSTFQTDRTETVNDHWKFAFLVFTSGSLVGQVRKINGYTGATKFVTTDAFTGTPSAGDTFILINS